jgi:hypothetical protein
MLSTISPLLDAHVKSIGARNVSKGCTQIASVTLASLAVVSAKPKGKATSAIGQLALAEILIAEPFWVGRLAGECSVCLQQTSRNLGSQLELIVLRITGESLWPARLYSAFFACSEAPLLLAEMRAAILESRWPAPRRVLREI